MILGKTEVYNIHHIDRGYENLVGKIRKLGGNIERIAKRFFSSREICVLEECEATERTQLFFDMWAGKEAYGKYIGDGITENLEKEIPATVRLQLIHSIPGYSLAICKAI